MTNRRRRPKFTVFCHFQAVRKQRRGREVERLMGEVAKFLGTRSFQGKEKDLIRKILLCMRHVMSYLYETLFD